VGLFKKSDREAFGAAAAAFAFLAVLLAFSSLAIAATRDTGSNSAAGTGGAGAQIGLSEYKIDPATLTASPGSEVTVKNDGTMPHNLTIEGTDKATKNLSPGESAGLSLAGLKKGSYKIYCTIPGHESAGMRGTLIIGSGGAVQTAKSGSTGLSPQELLATNAENDKTQGKGVTTYATQLSKIVGRSTRRCTSPTPATARTTPSSAATRSSVRRSSPPRSSPTARSCSSSKRRSWTGRSPPATS
jgi:plastocyanin